MHICTIIYVWILILGGGGGGGHPYRRSGGYNDRRYNRGNNEQFLINLFDNLFH